MPILFPPPSTVSSAPAPHRLKRVPTLTLTAQAIGAVSSMAGPTPDRLLRQLAGCGGTTSGPSQAGSARMPPPALSVVIPVYRELENGNLFRLLESFARQSSEPAQFELVFVVNNGPKIAGKLDDPVYVENQRTLLVMEYLSGGLREMPKFLHTFPEWQRRSLRLAKMRGIRCRAIDLSTDGIEKNIGRIRDRGVRDVLRRWGDRGVVAMLDADTTVEPGYVDQILTHFSTGDLQVLILNRSMRPSGEGADFLFYQTHFHELLSQVWQTGLLPSLGGRRHGIEVASPQIVARGSALQAVGGVPHRIQGEDLELSRLLCSRFRYRMAPDIVVTVADRARVESWDGGMRRLMLENLRNGERERQVAAPLNPRMTFLAMALQALFRQNLFGRPDEAVLERLFCFFGFPFDKTRWARAIERAESRWVSSWRDSIETFLTQVYRVDSATNLDFLGFLESYLSPDEWHWLFEKIHEAKTRHEEGFRDLRSIILRILRNRALGKELLAEIDDERIHEFFRSNPWISRYLEDHKDQLIPVQRGLDFLSREFPDWLRDFDETPVKKKAAQLEILARFIQEARNNPSRFPQMHRLLRLLNGELSAREFFEETTVRDRT